MKQTESETIATRKYHANHREERRLYAARHRREHPEIQQAHRHRLDKFKDVPCADCGNRFPPECMDFDHVRGQKLFGLGPNRTIGLQRLLDEIAKCDVVCSNCHRIRTRKRLIEKQR